MPKTEMLLSFYGQSIYIISPHITPLSQVMYILLDTLATHYISNPCHWCEHSTERHGAYHALTIRDPPCGGHFLRDRVAK